MRLFLILFIFLITSLFATENEILLLHSYNKGLKWSDGISKGVEDVFKKHPNYELTTEYMDSKKIDTKEYFNLLSKLYTKKFAKRKYKAVIASDNYAFEFAIANHNTLFKDIPIVFCGVENFDKKNIPLFLQNRVTGVMEYKNIRKNLQLISDLMPNVSNLYIMSDNSFSSLAIKKQILDTAKEYKNKFKTIYDNNISLSDIDNKLNKLPKNSAILFTSFYKDRDGNYITYAQLKSFFQNSKFPIIALNQIHLGEGVIGGVMINPYEQGYISANMVFDILDGKSSLQIPTAKPPSRYYFDYEVFKKFELDKSKVPIMSTFINEPKNFFEKNRKLVDSVFLMMPLLVLLIIGLIINIVKKTKLEIKLLEQNKLDSVLLNNVKNSIFWKSTDEIILGCNYSFCKLLNLSKDEIIGKNIKEVIADFSKKVDSKTFDKIEVNLNITNSKNIDALIRSQQYFDKDNNRAGVVTVIEDITDIKKLEMQRKKDEQFLIQRSKVSEIGEMMSSIAHQWKAPLVEISTIAQELFYKKKKQHTLSQEYTQDVVNDIMNQVGYMTKTIDDFRAFIKPSNKKILFNANEALRDLLNVIEHNIKYNYIDLEINYDKKISYYIYGYPNEFKQCILNIINNAKDSILEKREIVEFDAKIILDIFQKDDCTCISIKDNALGIKEQDLESIFEPYFSSKKDGDGFGLYMAKLIIEDKMGGEIKAIKSSDGASFLICIKSKDYKNNG